jgi:arabinan endo-1,5-alpha-L-arabinosidase
MRHIFYIIALLTGFNNVLPAQTVQQNIPVHDPVIIREDSVYYVFATGRGIAVWSSTDRISWKREKPVFDTLPWGVAAVPGFKNHIWAPDISYSNGLYYLYYSVSTFGKNNSCIGVATNTTLNPSAPAFKWTDHGKLVQSIPGRDHWNAIDPNLIEDEKGNAFLSFGSFWDGIKLVQLSQDRLSIAGKTDQLLTIASRKKDSLEKGGNAIEAPFIFKKNNYYYLFASIDLCCKGKNSTYKMIVGRSESVTGPYFDKEEQPMSKGGGTLLLQGDNDWYGVGHNAVAHFDGADYLVFHGYDAADNSRSKLRIEKLGWDKEGWPFVSTDSLKQ